MLVFCGGEGKPDNPKKHSQSKVVDKVNPHETLSTGVKPGSQRCEASAYPLRHPWCLPGTTPRGNHYGFFSATQVSKRVSSRNEEKDEWACHQGVNK